jgi:hypothetical protein
VAGGVLVAGAAVWLTLSHGRPGSAYPLHVVNTTKLTD